MEKARKNRNETQSVSNDKLVLRIRRILAVLSAIYLLLAWGVSSARAHGVVSVTYGEPGSRRLAPDKSDYRTNPQACNFTCPMTAFIRSNAAESALSHFTS
jgi:hypothetical protein